MTQKTQHIVQKNGYEFMFTDNGTDIFYATVKKVNPKTGKGWQAGRTIYQGESRQKAMREWLYAIAKAKGE